MEPLVEGALAEIGRQTRAEILIIEDDPIAGDDLAAVVAELGHQLIGVASTEAGAIEMAARRKPGLVLADIQLADGSSGIDAATTIHERWNSPVIFVTGFPERLLTPGRMEPTFLVTKPYYRSTIKAAIEQALFFDPLAFPQAPAEEPPDQASDARDVEEDEDSSGRRARRRPRYIIPPEALEAKPGPLNATVDGGRLRLADSTPPVTATPINHLEAVRHIHFETAERLCVQLAGSNVGPALNARLDAVRRTLSHRVSEEGALQIGIQVEGLELLSREITERLDEANASDLRAFTRNLAAFARQFPSYRNFVEEARTYDALTAEGQRALVEVATRLEGQPSELIEPALKQALGEVRTAAEDQPSAVAGLALLRAVGNVVKAIARALNSRFAGIQKEAVDSFEKEAGSIVGKGLARLLIAAPITAGLLGLYAAFPKEFAFVWHLLEAAKNLL